MNLLDDLAGYTFEKIAAEEMNEEDRYNQELAKAKKRKQIGLGLMGGGFGGNLAINRYGVNKARKRIAADENFDDVLEFAKKMDRIRRLPVAAFWAGAGTLGYNSVKKREARRRYEDYLKSRED